MKKRIVSLFLIMTMFVISSMNVFATTVSDDSYTIREANLPGIIHEDGSYQLSEGELKRMIEFEKNHDGSYSLAELLSYATPLSYECLSAETKAKLSNVRNHEVGLLADSCTTDFSYLSGCSVSISRYGNSLKGVATMNRQTMDDVPAEVDGYFVICKILNNNGETAGFSYQESDVANFSVTTIVDPPSGTYTAYGYFEIPYNCPDCFEWTRISADAETDPFSYVNPNG